MRAEMGARVAANINSSSEPFVADSSLNSGHDAAATHLITKR
jgi:hypothetical protein